MQWEIWGEICSFKCKWAIHPDGPHSRAGVGPTPLLFHQNPRQIVDLKCDPPACYFERHFGTSGTEKPPVYIYSLPFNSNLGCKSCANLKRRCTAVLDSSLPDLCTLFAPAINLLPSWAPVQRWLNLWEILALNFPIIAHRGVCQGSAFDPVLFGVFIDVSEQRDWQTDWGLSASLLFDINLPLSLSLVTTNFSNTVWAVWGILRRDSLATLKAAPVCMNDKDPTVEAHLWWIRHSSTTRAAGESGSFDWITAS